jgi:hypothetical protein
MYNLAQPAAAPVANATVAGQWVTIALLLGAYVFLNWKAWTTSVADKTKGAKVSPYPPLFAIAIGMGAFGMFLNILDWGWVESVSGWTSNFLKVKDTPIAPFFWIFLSAAMRAAQLFQGEKGPIHRFLKATPDLLEAAVIILCGAMGGLAMNGAQPWENLFEGVGRLVAAFGEVIGLIAKLFGIGG